jgi:hypothetical protein
VSSQTRHGLELKDLGGLQGIDGAWIPQRLLEIETILS